MALQEASSAETRRRAIRKQRMSAGAIYDAPPAARQQKPAGDGRRVAWVGSRLCRQNLTRIVPSISCASPLKLATVTRWPQPYSTPKSTNATGLQNRLACAVASCLLRVVFCPTRPVFMLVVIPLTSIVERRFSVHQCWYQIQPFAAVGD